MKWWTCSVFIVLLATACLSQGCCSIVCGESKTVTINSDPAGADFVIKDKHHKAVHSGKTPATVTLKRGANYFSPAIYTVTMTKDGYESQDVALPQTLETGWYFGGNIVFGGLIGWFIVDPLTGAMYNIGDAEADLSPVQPVVSEASPPVKTAKPAEFHGITVDASTGQRVRQ